MKGATAWPQGFGWWVVFKGDNGKLYKRFYRGQQPPKGIEDVKQGPGEARRGIQQKFGVGPHDFSMPMGITRVSIEKPSSSPGKKGTIGFEKVTYQRNNIRIVETQETATSRQPKKKNTILRRKVKKSKVADLGADIVKSRHRQHIRLR